MQCSNDKREAGNLQCPNAVQELSGAGDCRWVAADQARPSSAAASKASARWALPARWPSSGRDSHDGAWLPWGEVQPRSGLVIV